MIRTYLYIAWACVVLGMVALLNIIHSRVGRSLRALHGSEEAADAMGDAAEEAGVL